MDKKNTMRHVPNFVALKLMSLLSLCFGLNFQSVHYRNSAFIQHHGGRHEGFFFVGVGGVDT